MTLRSFGFLPLGDTPSPGNSQNTIPFITPSPIGLGGLSGSIIENVQQPPKVKVSWERLRALSLSHPVWFTVNGCCDQNNFGSVHRTTTLNYLAMFLCYRDMRFVLVLALQFTFHPACSSAGQTACYQNIKLEVCVFSAECMFCFRRQMTRRSQQASGLPATKPLLQSGLQGNVPGGGVAPGGVRRSTRLFSSNNTNPTSSSVKVRRGARHDVTRKEGCWVLFGANSRVSVGWKPLAG